MSMVLKGGIFDGMVLVHQGQSLSIKNHSGLIVMTDPSIDARTYVVTDFSKKKSSRYGETQDPAILKFIPLEGE